MKFIATAEHTAGADTGHPCSKGIYSDPTDSWTPDIEAPGLYLARKWRQNLLVDRVSDYPACDCRRKEQPGSNRWWASVVVHLWPQDEAALAVWAGDGGDSSHDPYGLIPSNLKVAKENEEPNA